MPTILSRPALSPANRSVPILADGTRLDELIDFDKREVSKRVLNDPEIHELELRRIFKQSWNIVGHVSEIPKRGDYITRYIGQDKVIISRTKDGGIAANLNACAHRGAELCWEDSGHASAFKCPYHGWVFDAAGDLVSAPFEERVYPGWDKARYGLRRAGVAIRSGVIFGTFNPDPPSLDEFLGDMGWYFDYIYGSNELQVVGPPRRMRMRANWKLNAEQAGGDAYHFATTHRSLAELGLVKTKGANDALGWGTDGLKQVVTPQGHSMMCTNTSVYRGPPVQNRPFAGSLLVGLIFPGTAFSVTPSPDPDSSPAQLTSIVPVAPGAFEEWRVSLVPSHYTEKQKQEIIKSGSQVTLITPDDFECWDAITRTTQGVVGREETIKYNTPPHEHRAPNDWPGPGNAREGIHTDDFEWVFWERWFDALCAGGDEPA